MEGKIKRMLAVLLALALCLSLAPAALADPAANDVTQEIKDAIGTGGQYALPADSVLSNMITIGSGETLTLDLNGHTLTAAFGARHFKVEAGGSLTLQDASGGSLRGNGGESGGVEVAGGMFRMVSGSISGCDVDGYASEYGGGVYLTDGTFLMEGGSIADCDAYVGGGRGGGVCMDGGMFTMTGGTIADCTVMGAGGGVYVEGGTFSLEGGTITGCSDGGVYVGSGQTLEVSGGPRVTGNTGYAGAADNVMLENNGTYWGKIAVTGPLADDASLGVTLEGDAGDWANREFLTGLPAGSKAFFPDSDPASYITRGTADADGKLMAAPRVPPPVADTAISLDKSALTLAPGETAKLKATLTPDDATYKYIFWAADKTDVATVSDSGLVTAVAEGTAVITAKSWYGHEAACEMTVKQAETPPPADSWPTEGLAGFVTRCYRVALGRDPDRVGHADWVRWLSDGTVDASSCAHGFVFSKEMNNKHLSDEAFIKTLYRLFLDREGEATGVAFWTDYLKTGHGREEVFGGFADSVEFGRIKAGYGIR